MYTGDGIRTVTLTVKAGDQTKTVNKTIEIQAAYTKVRIMKTTILNAATAYPSETGWDLSTTSTNVFINAEPDVYLIARFDGETIDAYYNVIKTNVTGTNLTNGNILGITPLVVFCYLPQRPY